MTAEPMQERLAPLCLLPPRTGTAWAGVAWAGVANNVPRRPGDPLAMEMPLFWYDPGWHRVPTILAAMVARAMTRLGVSVSALHSEVTPADGPPNDESPLASVRPALRLLPYRPERYGLRLHDFQTADVIDVRLAMARDGFGRFAYPPSQIQRWEATSDEDPLAGGGWLPAATLPPDVASIDHLSTKLDQLRLLAPDAALYVSIGPIQLDDALPRVLATGPDGIVLRLDAFPIDGVTLASLTRRTREAITRHASPQTPLWVVPGPIAPPDAVKLIELGANAVAIDAWCDPVLRHATQIRPPSSFAAQAPESSFARNVEAFVREQLAMPIETFRGYAFSANQVAAAERLGTFDETWARSLDVPDLR